MRGGRFRVRLIAKVVVLITSAALLSGWQALQQPGEDGRHVRTAGQEFTPLSSGLDAAHGISNIHHSRQLLFTLPNCTPPAVENFPRDMFTSTQRRSGGIVLHILVALYSFVALALVCDDYFVPACEVTTEVLKLEPDVAGATFMAAGSSAPELATAVIGVFIAKDDIGVGSVVGSAVFNIMFVISVCALFAGRVVKLQWWPLVRDCSFYSLSIITLAATISDGFVQWYEAVIFLSLYTFYIGFMCFNSRVEGWIAPQSKSSEKETIEYDKVVSHGAVVSDSEDEINQSQPECKQIGLPLIAIEMRMDAEKHFKEKESSEGEASPFSMPEGCLRRVLWTISLPVICLHFITIPDCRKDYWKKCFVLTFLMSCVWISLYSYVMVWMITVAGHTFGIPDTIMGLTLIAAGVSVPDAIASLIVCKDGYGDMAVSNAVGSNVFDILLCLGLPWFIKTVIISPGTAVEVYSEGLVYATLTLLLTVLFLLVATHVNGWKLDKKYGVVLIMWYLLFMLLASLYELNIFKYVHPPECLSFY